MKTRIAAVTVLAVLLASNSWGFLPPKSETLPNYDKRTATSSQSAAASEGEATALLKSAVPSAHVSRDPVLGTPSLVGTSVGFLTGPGGVGKGVSAAHLNAFPVTDSHRTIKAFLNEHSALFGHDSQVLESARITRDYVTDHNGLQTTVWEQTLDGIAVFDGLLVGHVTRNGELVSISDRFVPDVVKAAEKSVPNHKSLVGNPTISAKRALVLAAANINTAATEDSVEFTKSPEGAEKKQTLRGQLFLGDVWEQLVWLPMNSDSLRLCWQVILTTRTPAERFTVLVDAETGEVLIRRNLTEHATPASYNVYTNDSPSPFSPGWPTPNSGQPPLLTNRTLVTVAALSTNASPAGWVSEGPGPQTSGNNAVAFLDRNFDGLPDIPEPRATTNRIFDFPLDLTSDPASYQSASIVQLFYRANWYHDKLYDMGFTEAAGNYQVDNFGRGGFSDDPVIGLVQAGADLGITDNSEFFSAPDGFSGYCAMFIFTGPTPDRDGSLDSEVVLHELTHGLSTRLVGAGAGISQLQTEGMGEGWSDFYALCLLSEPTDPVNGVYAAGAYVSYLLESFPYTQNYYFGIRRYPYTTDMSKNPLTFKDIDPTKASVHAGIPINPLFGGSDPSEVHNQGEVWCMTLREMWANLVTKWGWQIGNKLALQIVTDGMRLAPANPTFLEARDAIIAADGVDNSGENFAEIWAAFAKRGMGFSAQCPPNNTTTGVFEAFDVPPSLTPDGILEIAVNPPSGEIFFAGETNRIRVTVSDGFGITNATITATIVGSTNLVFRNDGQAPDEQANNSVYSALLRVPTNLVPITIDMVITAPGKTNSTNSVTYTVVTTPPNDNFANAIKVPVSGTNYLTSNRRATIETNEPVHAGISSSAASLWWNYTPAVNTNVLVDTGGSGFRSIVAVYTNNSLANLSNVVSASGAFSRLGAVASFNGHAGVTYHIAVASYDPSGTGLVNLNIIPGGQADTNPPVVTVSSPPDGLVVSTNRIFVTGTAVDPSPNGTGVRTINISTSSSLGEQSATVAFSDLLSTNWSSLVGLTPGQNTIQVSAIDVAGNRSAPVSIRVTYRVLDPVNDFFANALVLTNTSGISSVNTVNATHEAGEPNHAGSIASKSAWWSFTPSMDGVLTLSTSNSTFDTVMAMYTGTSVSQLTPIASNDDAPGGNYSLIVQAVRSNVTYRIAVDGYDGLSGVVFLNYSFTTGLVYQVTINSGGGGTVTPTSANVQSNGTVNITAIPDAGYQFDLWDGDVISLNSSLTLVVNGNMTVTAHFRPMQFTEDFETGDLLHLPWVTSGNKPWLVQTNVVSAGTHAARSGGIPNNQSSSLILTSDFHEGPGSFDYRVSSEPGFDLLKFYVDGVVQQQWSGEVGWANYPFNMTAGTHTLEWRYTKDTSGSSGLDAAFLDNINLPIAVSINSSSRANLQLRRQVDGTLFLDAHGQTNQWYVLQGSTNLVNWQNISTNTATGGFFRISGLGNGASGTLFYRAVVAP